MDAASAILTVSDTRSGCFVPAVTAPSFLATSRKQDRSKDRQQYPQQGDARVIPQVVPVRGRGRAAGGKLGHDGGRRSSAVMVIQPPISTSERPQPMQKPARRRR